jgi:hypothetical protein
MEFVGEMKVLDEANGLEVAFKFDGDSKKGGWFGGGVVGASDIVRAPSECQGLAEISCVDGRLRGGCLLYRACCVCFFFFFFRET